LEMFDASGVGRNGLVTDETKRRKVAWRQIRQAHR